MPLYIFYTEKLWLTPELRSKLLLRRFHNLPLFVQKLRFHAEKKLQELSIQDQSIREEYFGVKSQIDNIVNAIAKGMFHISMKEKMNILETRKAELEKALIKADIEKTKYDFNDVMVRQYLETDIYPTKKTADEQRRLVQRYIKRVNLYADHVEVNYMVNMIGCETAITFVSTILLALLQQI